MVSFSLDTTELRQLSTDLTMIPGELSRHANPIMAKAALNVKKELQDDLRGSGNGGFQHVASTVSYDLGREGNDIVAEIGPSKPAGALANVAYFGTWKGGGTVPDPIFAAENEAPELEKYLGDLVEELWG